MAARTVFDFYRADVATARQGHYTYWTPTERTAWHTEELHELVVTFAGGLKKLGVARGDRVLLLCDNRPEWHAVDLAVLSLGAVDVPVYGTLTAQQIALQAGHAGAVAAVVDTRAQMEKLLEAQSSCPRLRHLIQIDDQRDHGVLSMAEVAGAGSSSGAADDFWRRAGEADEADPITLIYTSGTTGSPKGVVLTHRNVVSNVMASLPRVPVDSDDLALEFLPLCHVLERMLGYAYMASATGRAYCSVHHVGELIAEIAPTVFCGVPRFFQKVHAAVLRAVGTSPLSAALLAWALGVGKELAHRQRRGLSAGLGTRLSYRTADRLVLAKIRQALGGRVRACISGGAPLPLDVAEFFHAAGVAVVEGYGLTETSPVIAVNGLGAGQLRLGTVGRPLDNLELRFAPDGELLVRGPSVFSGYWNDTAATAEAFDEDGFFRTGDIAELDDDGFLLITDRKKELIVTAGGKNVAPGPIESELQRGGLIESAVVVGEQRPYLVALLVPNLEELRVRARSRGLAFGGDLAELVGHDEVWGLVAAEVDRANAGLARFEQIKRFALVAEPLTVESGLLTPTLKVKRHAVERRFRDVVEDLYRHETS